MLGIALNDLVPYPGLGSQGQFTTRAPTGRPRRFSSSPFSPSRRARARQTLTVVGWAPETFANSSTRIPDCLRKRTTIWRSICRLSIVSLRTSILSMRHSIPRYSRVFKGHFNNTKKVLYQMYIVLDTCITYSDNTDNLS